MAASTPEEGGASQLPPPQKKPKKKREKQKKRKEKPISTHENHAKIKNKDGDSIAKEKSSVSRSHDNYIGKVYFSGSQSKQR